MCDVKLGALLGRLADGMPVHGRTDEDHLLAHPTALPFLEQAFSLIEGGIPLGEAAAYELDLGEVIGVQTCVETGIARMRPTESRRPWSRRPPGSRSHGSAGIHPSGAKMTR